jgi:putative sterol carrier protein
MRVLMSSRRLGVLLLHSIPTFLNLDIQLSRQTLHLPLEYPDTHSFSRNPNKSTTMSIADRRLHLPHPRPVQGHTDPTLIAKFPSSAAFDAINAALTSSSEREDAIKKGGAIFAFTLKNSTGAQESWHIDLKESGKAGKGTAPDGKKSAVTMSLSDADFEKLVKGEANAQKLFMSGKLKVKGDVMKATKMEPIFKKMQGKAKL